jgi:hypothetical protein
MALIQNVDFRIQGYYKVPTVDDKGDTTVTNYYQNYDSGTDTYSNLMVQETVAYNRNALGIPESETHTIRWYKGGVEKASKAFTRNYTEENGYEVNQTSRQRLIDRASIYLFSSLISEYGAETGAQKAYEFLNDVIIGKTEYTAGNKQVLLTEVDTSTRDYMTAQRKADITNILDVSYIPQP